jgi:glycosyltransferase involved in cell wall biosynthesis
MGAGAPVLAYDVEFNREVTAGQALLWADADALTEIVDGIAAGTYDGRLAELRALGQQRIRDAYQWDTVTDDYEALIQKLAKSRRARR